MKMNVVFSGLKEYVSKTGKAYADIYFFDVSDGVVGFEQQKFRTFDPVVLRNCKTMKNGDAATLELQIKDAVVVGADAYVEV